MMNKVKCHWDEIVIIIVYLWIELVYFYFILDQIRFIQLNFEFSFSSSSSISVYCIVLISLFLSSQLLDSSSFLGSMIWYERLRRVYWCVAFIFRIFKESNSSQIYYRLYLFWCFIFFVFILLFVFNNSY